jgi:molybdopterin converting factor small subunit
MQIRIEFFGIARSRAGLSECTLEFAGRKETTLGEALQSLGERLPQLQGECLELDRPAQGYTVNLNGQAFVREPGTRIRSGDCLLLLSVDAGG